MRRWNLPLHTWALLFVVVFAPLSNSFCAY
jgi:hypothetical protein